MIYYRRLSVGIIINIGNSAVVETTVSIRTSANIEIIFDDAISIDTISLRMVGLLMNVEHLVE
jgi:hypothetical protein